MNKVAPKDTGGGKGSKDDKDTRLGLSRPRQREILARALKRFKRASEAEAENRKDGVDDQKFEAGNQWPANIQAQRTFDKRPCMTINRLPTLINQITNSQRENRPAITISPIGDRGDPKVAKMYRGLIRYSDRQSDAELAYDTAFHNAAAAPGWGYWRTLTRYDRTDSFDQTITIAPIRNPYTVYIDPDHKNPTGADAKFWFISEMMSREDFEDEYPHAQKMPWTESGIGDMQKNWIEKDRIRIAEYFEYESNKRTLLRLGNGSVVWKDEADEKAIEQFGVIEERESDEKQVKWYKLTAVEVLEEREWVGKYFPIVKVVGNQLDVEGKVIESGVVRNAKDAQRSYNYCTTMEMEGVALVPKAPYIGAFGQFEGHEDKWRQAHTKSYPYLEYNPVMISGQMAPPPARQPMAQMPQGWEALKQAAAQDLLATTGIRFDSTLQERMYDESGKALRELQHRGDIGSYHYIDNLSRSLRRQGEIYLDLIPKIYNRRQVMTILREDDSEERVMIDPNAPKPHSQEKDPQTGKMMDVFNPTIGQYGVTVTVGPSYASRRIEALERMTEFARAFPQAAPLIMDLVAKMEDWEGSEEIATRLAKALPPGLLTPEMKDVPPQVQAILGQLQQQVQQLTQEKTAMMQQLMSQDKDRAITMDKIQKDFDAKLLGIVAKIETEANKAAMKAVESHNKVMAGEFKDLAQGVTELKEALINPQKGNSKANA